MDIAKIFHQQTKQKYEKGSEKPTDFSTWPKEWATIYFKEYPRLAKVLLPKPDPIRNEISNGARKLESSLGEVLLKRKSEREFNGEPINLKGVSPDKKSYHEEYQFQDNVVSHKPMRNYGIFYHILNSICPF